MRQMTLFDSAESLNAPRFKTGDDIYQVVLDVISHYRVSSIFSNGVDLFGEHTESGQTLWGYHLDEVDVSAHDIFSEYKMGNTWFDSLGKAEAWALRNRRLIEGAGMVLRAEALKPVEYVAYQLKEGPGGNVVHCQAARLSPLAVLEKKPYCYPFIKVFETEKKAARYYASLAEDLLVNATGSTEYRKVDMYRVSKTLWSGYEYAERHGEWDFLHEPQGREEGPNSPMTRTRGTRDHER